MSKLSIGPIEIILIFVVCGILVIAGLTTMGHQVENQFDQVTNTLDEGGSYGGGYSSRLRRSKTRTFPFQQGGRGSIARQIPERELSPQTSDELWVISRPEGQSDVRPGEDEPGSGALLADVPGQTKEVPVPLKHTDVKAGISAYIASVTVTQQFHNPFDEKIEAKYVFPLPQNSAVNEFIMVIGDRRIRGIIREREEAEKIYHEARARGHVASLLTQERPNIFTQKVANIEPGKEIDVEIKYFNTLTYKDGWYEFVFPMVVGPRFNPPGSTDGVGAVARGAHGISGQDTEVQHLKPDERNGHDISLSVEVDAGVSIEEMESKSHAVRVRKVSASKATVSLSPLDTIPNKDFVLRYRVAGERVKSALLTHRDKRGGFFTLMLYPPAQLRSLERHPMEMVFVLDCSGSMKGEPISQAKDAVKHALKKMGKNDTFQIIRFSNDSSQFGRNPVKASRQNVQKALRYVKNLHGGGGTMMIEGIKAALDFPHDERRLRTVAFLTDGYIGNEKDILAAVKQKVGSSRIFSFGVGSSPNRYLLNRMAKLGRGAVAYLGLHDSGADVMNKFFRHISHPALTDVKIDWGEMEVSEVYPREARDLFVGRPIVLTGRFRGIGRTRITVRGRAGGRDQQLAIRADLNSREATHRGLAEVWARAKIADLYDQATYDSDPELPTRIKNVALNYGLMSQYTSFVAVDSLSQTAGDHGTTVAVPVPVPEGVKYETTVEEN
ncbi:MAG: VWA domain-containing protein [Planctomycetes bacterium]|nr:VWA domain-containing protein [Planctomycetota bacterium]